jgi:hypothetical protein
VPASTPSHSKPREGYMQLDTSKLYPVNVVFVRDHWRKNYQRPAILVKVEIPELLTTTTRTLNLPKTLDPEKAKPNCIFKKVMGKVMRPDYPDTLLGNTKQLATILNEDLAGKRFLARFEMSKDGHYIDLSSLLPVEDKAA